MIETRERKSKFVKRFDKTQEGVICPHFYELILSNGCPYNCLYCYLKLTFRGKTHPQLFENNWEDIKKELDNSSAGVYNTGELADSLAVIPPNLANAMDYFEKVLNKYLLLVTKSDNIGLLLKRQPNDQIIISFSVNSQKAWRKYEKGTPSQERRIKAIKKLLENGWRVRMRLDPIILDWGIEEYREICEKIKRLKIERLTVGSLRQYATLSAFSKEAPKKDLELSFDRRLRYPFKERIMIYEQIAEWLGFAPALCKETEDVWRKLGWKFEGCNCTV